MRRVLRRDGLRLRPLRLRDRVARRFELRCGGRRVELTASRTLTAEPLVRRAAEIAARRRLGSGGNGVIHRRGRCGCVADALADGIRLAVGRNAGGLGQPWVGALRPLRIRLGLRLRPRLRGDRSGRLVVARRFGVTHAVAQIRGAGGNVALRSDGPGGFRIAREEAAEETFALRRRRGVTARRGCAIGIVRTRVAPRCIRRVEGLVREELELRVGRSAGGHDERGEGEGGGVLALPGHRICQ